VHDNLHLHRAEKFGKVALVCPTSNFPLAPLRFFHVYDPLRSHPPPLLPPHTQSKCCFVKAALPWILELLTTHFKYSRGSVNDGYVQSLRALVLNIYSQKCVPQIDEEVEVSARRPPSRICFA